MRPLSLYSHADQQAQWQSAISSSAAGTGWGGRIADKVASFNAASGFPVVTSLDGTVLFTTGAATVPLSIPVDRLVRAVRLHRQRRGHARLAAVQQLLAAGSGNAFVTGANAIGTRRLQLSATVNPILANTNSTVAPLFANLKTSTANQLYQVAKMIEARAATGAKRQIFFVQLGSFDTHGDQINRQQTLFAELSPALKAFYDATVALGVSSQVTTFTLVGLRPHVPAGVGRRHRPRLGQSPLHHRRRGPGRLDLRPISAARARRTRATRKAKAAGCRRPRSISTARRSRSGSACRRRLERVFPNLAKFATGDLGFMS